MLGRIADEIAAGLFPARIVLEREALCGLPCLLGRTFFLPGDSEAKRRRIYRRLFRRMAAAGVRRVILPPGFSCGQELACAGLSPFPALGLYRAVAPQLALSGLREGAADPEHAAVVLTAAAMNRSLWEAAFALSRKVRHLVVDVDGGGGEALRNALRRHCGLPVLDGALHPADFTLYYQVKAGTKPEGPGFLLCTDRNDARPRPGSTAAPGCSCRRSLVSSRRTARSGRCLRRSWNRDASVRKKSRWNAFRKPGNQYPVVLNWPFGRPDPLSGTLPI